VVAHICNPSYSGGGQEDGGSRSFRENVRETLSTNKPSVVAVTRDASYKPCRQEDHGNVDLDKNEKP
jgi:hypothetical protein